VIVLIDSATGPAFIGKAEIVGDPAVQDEMIGAIPRKYWLARMGCFGPKRAKFDAGQTITIRISPKRDLTRGISIAAGHACATAKREGCQATEPLTLPSVSADRGRRTIKNFRFALWIGMRGHGRGMTHARPQQYYRGGRSSRS